MPRISLCPDTTLVESFSERSGGTLRGMLAELLDNAFDQNATRIEITSSDDSLIIEDNGNGVSEWNALLRLGRHRGRGGTIGRYGVGFKHATAWLAEVVDIETRRRNARSFTRLDWTALAAQDGDWGWDVGEWTGDKGPPYTRLTLSGIRKRRLRNLAQVAEELASRYSPGLSTGVTILIDGNALAPVALPLFDGTPSIIEGSYEGRNYRLTAGIKPDHAEPERCGYDVAYLHRIIRQKDLSGCGNYSGQRFYGYLELLNTGEADWTLSDHKDDFDERTELYDDELFPQIEPILKAAAAAKDSLEFRDCGRIVTERFHFAGQGKEKRHPGETKGPRTPKETGRKRNHASEIELDPLRRVTSKLRSCGVTITFACQDPTRVGVVQSGSNQIVVDLNPSYPAVAAKDADAITVLVCALLALDDEWHGRNRQLLLRLVEADTVAPQIKDLSNLLLRVLPPEHSEASAG
jgi:hypothetical protein